MMKNEKYVVYHSSEFPPLGADEEQTYVKPPPKPRRQWKWYEVLGAFIVHKIGSWLLP